MDMIERVAKAMCEQCAADFGGAVPFEESPARDAWISSARAAIEAMREPIIDRARAAIQYSGCPSPDIEDEIVVALADLLSDFTR